MSHDIASPPHITVELEDHVATVWLDRADKLNAMARSFWSDLPEVMGTLGELETVRCVVFAGRGPAFTVGLDLTAFGPKLAGGTPTVSDRTGLYADIKKMQRTFTSIAECPKPVIAAVHGYCIGAGVDLITACDIRLASTDAVFSVRETRLGMVADVGTLQRLPRIVDPGRVADLVFTGRDFAAAEAAQIGLVSHVFADRDALMKHAMDLAAEISTNSPLAVQGSKWVLRQGADMSLDHALEYVAVWNSSFLASDDLGEAMEAFSEKRPPRFTGQ